MGGAITNDEVIEIGDSSISCNESRNNLPTDGTTSTPNRSTERTNDSVATEQSKQPPKMGGAITNDEVIEIGDSSISCNESRNNLPSDGTTSSPNRSTERTNDSVATEQSTQPKVMDHLVRSSKFILTSSWLLTERIVSVLLFLIVRYFVGKTSMVLYFVYGLRRSAIYFFWLGSILLAWGLLIGLEFKGSKFIYFVITSTQFTCVIGTGIWILKIVILKVLACGLCDKNFFNNIQDLISQQYILQTLLEPSIVPAKGDGKAQLKWITQACVNIFDHRRLFIICDALEKTPDNDVVETFVDQIFKNLKKNELREINEADLLQVFKEEDVANVLKLFEVTDERKVIDQTCLKNWTVKVYEERKILVHLLSDTNIDLNFILSGIILFLISMIWLCFMGFATTKVLLGCIVSLAVFFLGIIFVFLQRPFDIGDRCVVDNEQLVVAEIRILGTVFLTENNAKLYYSNSNLLTKSILNYNRSSETSDILELLVDLSTSVENIAALSLKIDEYLKSNSRNYHPEHRLLLKEIEDKKKKFMLRITRTMKFQNYEEMENQRSELLLELKNLFEELGINYFDLKFVS